MFSVALQGLLDHSFFTSSPPEETQGPPAPSLQELFQVQHLSPQVVEPRVGEDGMREAAWVQKANGQHLPQAAVGEGA